MVFPFRLSTLAGENRLRRGLMLCLTLVLLASPPNLVAADMVYAMRNMMALMWSMLHQMQAGYAVGASGFGGTTRARIEDLRLLYRTLPGAPPRSPVSRTALLDGIWLGQYREIVMIRDGYFRLYSPGYTRYEDAELTFHDGKIQLRTLRTEDTREYTFVYDLGRLALKDKDGHLLLYLRLDILPGIGMLPPGQNGWSY